MKLTLYNLYINKSRVKLFFLVGMQNNQIRASANQSFVYQQNNASMWNSQNPSQNGNTLSGHLWK